MTNASSSSTGSPTQERVVIVTSGRTDDSVARYVQDRYPEWQQVTCQSYLSGVAELARTPSRAVVAVVDGGPMRLAQAVAGLREAAGPKTKIVLCCEPETEPIARRAVSCGADDYVLLPFDGADLDAALAYGRPSELQRGGDAACNDREELALLGEALAQIEEKPMALIERLAKLVRIALHSRGATVIVQGAMATDGEVVTKPVLSSPLTDQDKTIGQITLAERLDGPYSPADTQKLARYASIAGHLLRTASLHRKWQHLAMTDECTGLPNRRQLLIRLDEILAQAAREHFHVTFLLFDVDDFKTFNDTFGHSAGDNILRLIGQLFGAHCRAQDVVARYGGDEFAVIFWDREGARVAGSSHLQGALAVLDRFRDALSRQALTAQLGPAAQGRLTISGGLASYPWDGSTGEALIEKADEALLAAKRAGKNRVFLIGDAERDAIPTE